MGPRPACAMRACLALALLASGGCAGESEASRRLTLVSTHTLEDSGLLDSLAAGFRRAQPGVRLRVVVVGSGEALAIGRRGDADVLLTHAPDAEIAFVRDGHGVQRRVVMHNDFVLLGPPGDPAGARAAGDAAAAFDRVREHGAPFISRGDSSGTHVMERAIWARTGHLSSWPRYVEAGLGMAEALRLASQRRGYVLSDRATWIVLQEQLALELAFEGDPTLSNVYAVTQVVKARNPAGATLLADWLAGPDARRRIESFRGGGLYYTE